MSRARVGIGAVVVVVVLARVPFWGLPLGADEGGFLLVASQWAPGPSLYGHYWVDRPPLLIDVFLLVHHLGGVPALRAVGALLVVASVLLAARIGRLLGGSPVATAAAAGVFLTTPLFGALEVNGEQVAMPFILGGIVLALQAARTPSTYRRAALLLATGAVGAAAVLVKQNLVDVAVLLAVGGLTFLRGERRRSPWVTWGLAALGALAATTVVLADAATRGTDPGELYDAVVTFRLDAAHVISTFAPSTVTGRLYGVLFALVGSGAPVLVVLMLRRWRRARTTPDLRWATVALLVWESTSVLAGGSYWLHYLICLVPAIVLSTAMATTPATATATATPQPVAAPSPRVVRTRPSAVGVVLALAVASCVVALGVVAAAPDLTGHEASPVVRWLDAHKKPGDTATVAFGHPDYLVEAGLPSPYSELWSLPVRVRDPHLTGFRRVLASPERPTWVITGRGGSLSGWGIDAASAQRVFARHYRQVADLGEREIFERRPRRG